MEFDTIVAISTPIGEGAIGIIRMSGPESFQILDRVFKKIGNGTFEDKQMVYGQIMDEDTIVDEVLAVKMYKPRTYTKEDVVEINCHGGLVPMRSILSLLLDKGARLAEKGEFTKRAFLNGRIDLAQAESVMDLIGSKTKRGYDLAMNQLEGHLSRRVRGMRDGLMTLMGHIEVGIDYPEEDIEDVTYPEIVDQLEDLEKQIDKLLKSANNGKIIREGLKTVIVGKPNVGKSSLMNALLKDSRAIVTDVPGTTRDVIEEYMNVGGIPIKLIDTAGIRSTEDVVEKIGVEKSKSYFNEADLIIFVLNASEPLTDEDLDIMEHVKNKHAIVIINKTDLEIRIDESLINMHLNDKLILKTSMEKEIGIDLVEKAISDILLDHDLEINQNETVSNTRHIHLLKTAHQNVKDALGAANSKMPYDFIEVDIQNAIVNLGQITGESVENDLLDHIFSNFCIGK
ncbi:tRNA uridine-5-carboxymethylaminomethyl(34) synthesis GTPase MnmE [Fusibacter tunisiensis]|uniref:tRNA modification GTPase MnmE n=1 Tax=Fusibacter tunisiensis TaxID=1008308 RepID=A0ABS2MNL7_9FIRM|nr:tRNA uridine-5-carboxymethylaminomethyl(34) synthesis GTPase MnmE [Fusibacter tunisiensis]MBM7560999.1 tRNA modification GTPase [Fusibacter tunisiensis]